MRISRVIVPLVLLTSVACFQGQRTFKINADGSGTIVDVAKPSAQALAMMKGLEGMDSTPAADKKAKQTAKFSEAAKNMGEGVTFVSVVSSPDGTQTMTYAFKDITKVRTSGMPTPDENTTSKGEPTTFRFAKNAAGNAVLTVVSPDEGKPGSGAGASAKKAPEDLQREVAMMKGMLAGLKIKSTVEVNGTLVKTSSPHATGSVVTLMEMDFDALDEAALVKLAGTAGGGPPSAAMAKGIKGIKVSDREVTIEFKPRN